MGKPNDNSGDQRAKNNAKHCRACGLNGQLRKPPPEASACSIVDNHVVEDLRRPPCKVFNDQVAAHPQHRNRSNNADCIENLGYNAAQSRGRYYPRDRGDYRPMRRALG